MSRLKLLAAAMLLALPIISACGDDVPPPPPTGSIDGLVSIEGQGQDGISVTLSNGATVTTANGGMFRFDGVEAGAYTVTISNYPDDASFDQTSAAATIATDGENVTVNFPGTWIRTAAIMGTVTVENEGLGGVTVKLSGMSDSETLTDGNGQYAFSGLRAGNYTVEISGFDEEDVAFGSTQSTAAVAVGESKVVTFEGTYLRASAITGQVTVEDNPLEGVTVSLQGRGEDRTATTNGAGQFTFSELRRGDYSVGITNPDTDEYSFEVTSRTVTIAHGETGTASFDGVLLRTATILGTVTVENVGGIPGVTVTTQGGEKGQEVSKTTNDAGQFSFTQLYEGEYSVAISGFDDDMYGFDVTTSTVTVERKGTATVPFAGIELRTAGIAGTVTVEGHPIPGVTVTVTGGPKDEEHETMTNDAGYYVVDELHAGDYAVTISDFDTNEYEFEATTQSISVGLRETATVAFQGDLLRTAGISGRVSVEGMGLDGITVTLSGDADKTEMTADGGQYAFAGLAEGDYTVAIEGWDEAAYSFDMTSADLEVMQDASVIQNFEGMHTRTASVSGMLFLDEVDANGMHNEGEPPFAFPGVPLLLQGPGVNDVQFGMTMPDGSYAFEDLMAGSYRVLVNMDAPGLADSLTAHGFRFAGDITGQLVHVAAAEATTVNFPFRIVMQTIVVGTVLGYADVEEHGLPMVGVSLELYANADDADNGTNMLGMATTDSIGVATFHFARAMDTGPGGQGTDHLVFVKYKGSALPNIVPSDNEDIEVAYASTARVSQAPTAVRVLNVMANFQWWVKSNETAEDGNDPLEGWKATNGMETDSTGLATYSGAVAKDDLPKTFEIVLEEDGQPDMGEEWKQSDMLTYTHTGLEHPAMNMTDSPGHDRGPIYVTWTTQSLTVGVYREADDQDGYTNYRSALPRGDHRPHSAVAKEMKIELLARDSRDRLRRYRWGEDKNKDGDPDKEGYASPGSNGLVTFTGIPADTKLTIRFHTGSSARKQVDFGYDEIETFDDDLDHGVTVGAFGDMSGGGPEVRMCSASDPSNADAAEDEWCATFGYVWMTGQLSGTVGGQKDHAVEIDPETGHGATGDDTKTDKDGAYSFTGIQDGEYSATASDQGDYTVDGTPTKKGIAVYHDEYADNKDEDKADSAWVGRRAQAKASWTTTKGGLGVWGYVANDDDGNNLVRGDEGMAGLEVKLLTNVVFHTTATGGAAGAGTIKSSKTAATTETAANGLYAFNGLNNKTKYWVQVVAGGDAAGYRNVAAKVPNLAGGSSGMNAQTYPALPEESTYDKPTWNRSSGVAGNTSVSYTVGTGAAAQTATLHNFGLVYTDGTVAGRVSNVSGSNHNIDVRIMSSLDDDDLWERATEGVVRGEFSVDNLMEGTYTAEVEDAGFGAPCLNAAGNAADDDNVDADGDCNNPAATTLSGTVEGRDDYQSMGTLYVYSSRMGDDDNLTSLTVVQTVGGEADTIGRATSITQDADGSTAVAGAGGGTIAFATESVSVIAKLMDKDAAAKAMIGKTACPGNACTLPYHATGGTTNAGGDAARETMITVMVTAENGYDDHAYTFMVSRTNPVDNVLGRDEIVNQAGQQAGGSGGDGQSVGNPWQVTTAGADSTAITLTFNLEEVGAGDDAICGQSVSVKINGGATQDAIADTDDDACDDEQYRLSTGTSGTVYEITIMSQDEVAKKYYMNLTKGTDAPENNAPTVATPIDDQMVNAGESITVDVDSNFEDADSDNLTFSAVSDATAMATVTVSGSMLTITGVAEGSAEITVTANDGNGGMVSDAFTVAVNNPPTLDTPIGDESVEMGATVEVDVDGHFSDTDALTYSAMSSAAATARVDDVTGTMITIAGVAEGSATITVTADDGNGGTAEGMFTVTVTAVTPAIRVDMNSLTLVETDSTSGQGLDTMVVMASLSVAPTADVSVVSILDPATGVATIDAGTPLTFTTANWDSAQAIKLTTVHDDDAADEMATLKIAVDVDNSSGSVYGDGVDTVEVTVNVEDDEEATISIAEDFTSVEVVEGGALTYTLTLSAPVPADQTVYVNLSVNGPASVSPTQAEFTSTTADNQVQVTVTALSDSDEEDGSVTISHTVDASDGSGYESAAAPSDISVTVKDDEVAGVVVSPTALSVVEGLTATYTVRLTRAPSTDESVTIHLAGTGVNLSATTLTFLPGDFSTPQTVTVTGHVDSDDQDDTATVVHTVVTSGGEEDYDGVTASTVNITVKEPPEEE